MIANLTTRKFFSIIGILLMSLTILLVSIGVILSLF